MSTAMPKKPDEASHIENRVRALIVDDEAMGRSLLRCLLRSIDEVEVIDEAETASEAVQKITALRPDLVFMDIEMPGGNGIDLLYGLPSQPFVIFVTAHAEFVLPALEFQVIDYLLKPVQQQRLVGSVIRARQRISERRLAGLATRIATAASGLRFEPAAADAAPQAKYASQIVIRIRRRIFWLDVGDIAWIEGASQYCQVHATSGDYMLSRSLASFESELDPQRFFRVHRSAIVNMAHVREIRSSGDAGHHLYLQGGQAVPISRSRRDVRRKLVEAIAGLGSGANSALAGDGFSRR